MVVMNSVNQPQEYVYDDDEEERFNGIIPEESDNYPSMKMNGLDHTADLDFINHFSAIKLTENGLDQIVSDPQSLNMLQLPNSNQIPYTRDSLYVNFDPIYNNNDNNISENLYSTHEYNLLSTPKIHNTSLQDKDKSEFHTPPESNLLDITCCGTTTVLATATEIRHKRSSFPIGFNTITKCKPSNSNKLSPFNINDINATIDNNIHLETPKSLNDLSSNNANETIYRDRGVVNDNKSPSVITNRNSMPFGNTIVKVKNAAITGSPCPGSAHIGSDTFLGKLNFETQKRGDSHCDSISTENQQTTQVASEQNVDQKICALNEQISQLQNELSNKNDCLSSVLDVLELYQNFIANKIDNGDDNENSQYQELIRERDQLTEDVKGVEIAFSDLHRRYEKSKACVEKYKANEQILKDSLCNKEREFMDQIQSFESYKNQSEFEMKRLLEENNRLRNNNASENMVLQVKFKKLEMKTQSLERELMQKNEENAQLNSMLDAMIAKELTSTQN